MHFQEWPHSWAMWNSRQTGSSLYQTQHTSMPFSKERRKEKHIPPLHYHFYTASWVVVVYNNSNTSKSIYCRCPKEMPRSSEQNLIASNKVKCKMELIGQWWKTQVGQACKCCQYEQAMGKKGKRMRIWSSHWSQSLCTDCSLSWLYISFVPLAFILSHRVGRNTFQL